MTFLAMSLAQTLALGSITTALVVVLFFLKLRRRRVLVGSALLWTRAIEEQHTHALAERLRRWASLLLTLLIALLIALSITRPYLARGDPEPRPLAIVLDASPSMSVGRPGLPTRWETAVREAVRILTAAPTGTEYLLADTSGRTRMLWSEDRDAAARVLESMRPLPGVRRFPVISPGHADVFFITDGVDPIELPSGVAEISVFEPADNVALTAFEVRDDPTSPSGYRAFIEVANYSPGAQEVAVLLSGAADRRRAWRPEIAPGETWQNDLDLSDFEGGALRVRIEAAGDALDLDDTAYAYLPPRNSIRVMLVTSSPDSYLETLLALSPRVELRVVGPSSFTDAPDVDVFVLDDYAPQIAPSRPALIFGAGGGGDWLPGGESRIQKQRITSWEPDHPVMREVGVYDIEVREALVLDPGSWTVVAASDLAPLILVDDSPVRRVRTGFRLEDSDLPFQAGFPVFVENVLGWFSGDPLALRSDLGEIAIAGEADDIQRLDGSAVGMRPEFGRAVFEANEPDLFTATIGSRRLRVAANFLDRRISNVNQTHLAVGGEQTEATGPRGRELWTWMLLVAAALIAFESWTYHERITL